MSISELKPCLFCKGGETRIEPHGQTWRGMRGYSDPICWRLTHFCEGVLPDDYVTNHMELRGRTEEQCVEAWNSHSKKTEKLLRFIGSISQTTSLHQVQREAARILHEYHATSSSDRAIK